LLKINIQANKKKPVLNRLSRQSLQASNNKGNVLLGNQGRKMQTSWSC